MTNTYDGATPLDNPRHELFAQLRFKGIDAGKSFQKSYPKSMKWKETALYPAASRLDKNSKVHARIQWLQSQAASKAVLSKQEAMEILTEIARASQADFATLSADGVWFHDFGIDKLRHRAVRKIKSRTECTGEGESAGTAVVTELELEPKVTAIERLAKMLGWDAPVKAELTGAIPWSEYLEKIREIDKATKKK